MGFCNMTDADFFHFLLQVAMALVDQMYGKNPPLDKDSDFDDVVDKLPYTEATMSYRRPIFLGSAYNRS